MWRNKLTLKEKTISQHQRNLKRKSNFPTCQELETESKARIWCQNKNLSEDATLRVTDIINNTTHTTDWRDHRKLQKKDRFPRSLECHFNKTPPRYWQLEFTK